MARPSSHGGRPASAHGPGAARRARAAAVLGWLALWQLAAWVVGRPLLLSGPVDAAASLVSLASTGAYWASVGLSALHVALGFLGSAALGCVLGAAASVRPGVRVALEPPMLALKAVPVACLVVILLLWVGSAGVGMACVAMVVLPAYYFSALEGLGARDRSAERALAAMGVRRGPRLLACVWPGLQPHLVATSRVAVGMAWKAGVAAELIALSGATLGAQVYQAKLLLDTPALMAWTVTVVACAAVSERLVTALVAASVPWGRRAAVALALSGRRDARGTGAGGGARLWARGLEVSHGGVPVAAPVTLEATPAAPVAVVGPSGAGKSSLAAAWCGWLRPSAGERGPGSPLGVLTQGIDLVDGLTAEENVALVCGDAAVARSVLGPLLPGGCLGRPVEGLSGGQRRRVALARALAAPAGPLVLDEPFSGLDAGARDAVAEAVRGAARTRAVVCLVHGPEEAVLLGARVVTLSPAGGA